MTPEEFETLIYCMVVICLLFLAAKASRDKERVMFCSLLFISVVATAVMVTKIAMEPRL